MTEEEMEKAIDRHGRRRKVFEEEGLSPDDAWDLADKMWERDADIGDHRRLCFECRNYVDRNCTKLLDRFGKPQRAPRFTLQNCPQFFLKGKS
jgi:hypothetical protein